MQQKVARFKVNGQDLIYDKENSDTGFVANTMGLYYIEITFSDDWSDCDKIYLLLSNGKYKEKMLMTKVSDNTYRNLINNAFVSTSALTLGCVGYKTSDSSLRYITDPDARNLKFLPSVELNDETITPTLLTELELIRLKVDKFEDKINEIDGTANTGNTGIQSDWNQTDETKADYIKNKPTITNGVDGKDGKDGYTPIKGVDYFDGEKGEKGDKGDTGPQGLQGEKGDKGDTGAQGPKGDTGDTGPQGDAFTYSDFTTEQLASLKGDKGDTGAQGEKGDKGDTGAQGNDYVLTDADKSDIATLVADLVITQGLGGSY